MATAARTWAAWDTTNAWENLADAGNSASVAYARDATDVAAKFTQATKNVTQTEFGRKSGAGDTWASIFGIPAGATVTQVQVTAWTKKLVANTKLSSHSVTIALIADSGARVTASDSINAVALGTTTDGSYVAQSAGSVVNVNGGSQAASTPVRLSLEYTVVTSAGSGSASVDQRFDDVQLTITYSEPVTVSPGVGVATYAGLAAAVLLPVTVAAGLGVAAWTGLAPTVSTPTVVQPAVGVATYTGFAPAVTAGGAVTLHPGVGVGVWTAFAPTVTAPVTLAPGTGAATYVGLAPTVQTPTEVHPGTGVAVFQSSAPAIGLPVTVRPGSGIVSWTGQAPTIGTPVTVRPGGGVATWTGLAPTLGAGTSVAPGTGVGTWAGFAPTIGLPVMARPGTATGLWAGLAPLIATPTILRPGLGLATWTGFAPTVGGAFLPAGVAAFGSSRLDASFAPSELRAEFT